MQAAVVLLNTAGSDQSNAPKIAIAEISSAWLPDEALGVLQTGS
jgi:hypothetical protein